MEEPRAPALVRFGTFEVDLRAGTLRRNGVKVRLPEQSFRVLAALLARPGEVVTREQLRLDLWPDETFVDFDNSINAAVNRLREALGDSAANPRFVATLPRRGYMFIAPVQGPRRESGELSLALNQHPRRTLRALKRRRRGKHCGPIGGDCGLQPVWSPSR